MRKELDKIKENNATMTRFFERNPDIIRKILQTLPDDYNKAPDDPMYERSAKEAQRLREQKAKPDV